MSWETVKRRRAAGLCVGCGKPIENGRRRCDECAERLKEYQRQRYAMLTKQHKCARCSKPMPKDWYYCLCASCRADKNARQLAYKKRLKERKRAAANRDRDVPTSVG